MLQAIKNKGGRPRVGPEVRRISIPLTLTPVFGRELTALAKRKQVPRSMLVRSAILTVYGSEMELDHDASSEG